jgi:hypothetical protein
MQFFPYKLRAGVQEGKFEETGTFACPGWSAGVQRDDSRDSRPLDMDVTLALLLLTGLQPDASTAVPAPSNDALQLSPRDATPDPQREEAEPAPEEPKAERSEPEPAEPDAQVTNEPAEPIESEPSTPPTEPTPANESESTQSAMLSQTEPLEGWDVDVKVAEAVPTHNAAFLGFSVGLGNCGPLCADIRVAGAGRFEAGYRWAFISLGASASILGANYRTSASDDDAVVPTDDAEGSLRFVSLYPFVRLNPAPNGRLDPFVSLGLGYLRSADLADITVSGGSGEVRLWTETVAAHVSAGIPIMVNDSIAIGPRFDKALPIAGRDCVEIDDEPIPGQSKCKNLERQLRGLNGIDRRAIRRARLRPWSASLEVRASF